MAVCVQDCRIHEIDLSTFISDNDNTYIKNDCTANNKNKSLSEKSFSKNSLDIINNRININKSLNSTTLNYINSIDVKLDSELLFIKNDIIDFNDKNTVKINSIKRIIKVQSSNLNELKEKTALNYTTIASHDDKIQCVDETLNELEYKITTNSTNVTKRHYELLFLNKEVIDFNNKNTVNINSIKKIIHAHSSNINELKEKTSSNYTAIAFHDDKFHCVNETIDKLKCKIKTNSNNVIHLHSKLDIVDTKLNLHSSQFIQLGTVIEENTAALNDKIDATQEDFETTIKENTAALNDKIDATQEDFETTIKENTAALNCKIDATQEDFETTIKENTAALNDKIDATQEDFETTIKENTDALNYKLNNINITMVGDMDEDGFEGTNEEYVNFTNSQYNNFSKIYNGDDINSFEFAMTINPTFQSVSFSSDKRLKKHIHTLKNSLNKINLMRGVEWTWKANDQRTTGLIAQELIKIDSDLVNDKEAFLSINYIALSGYFIEAFKEQTRIQKTQEDKINLLESQLVGQQKEIDTLKTQMKFLLSKL